MGREYEPERRRRRSEERRTPEREREVRSRERKEVDRIDWKKQERRDDRREERRDDKREDRRPPVPYYKEERERIIPEKVVKVNRKQVVPFFTRVFYSINCQNSFKEPEKLPTTEVQLHLWFDSSLREIGQLLRAHIPALRNKQKFTFWRVHLNKEKKELVKEEIGVVGMHRRSDKNQEKYLCNHGFAIGDYLDVSVTYK